MHIWITNKLFHFALTSENNLHVNALTNNFSQLTLENKNMAPFLYRPDIDGLRAIAVISVLFFHLEFDLFKGGFVGVDIFFVISGFLITSIISTQIKKGEFSLRGFYLRRARRLFPALFATNVLTLISGIFVLYPNHLERLGASSIFSILSVSNIFFWSESGYFDASTIFKPLLHTWSLSVEEQFYLFWPFTLLLLNRGNGYLVTGFIVVSSILSLYYAQKILPNDPAAAYFFAPFRLMEFGFGALLATTSIGRIKYNLLEEVIFFVGLALICYSIFTFSESTAFPGLNSAIPCAGAALLIYSGRAKYLGLLLRNKLSVGIGLVSYSLYLTHWPIIVYTKYLKPSQSFGPKLQIFALFIIIIPTILMYFFVELKFRYIPTNINYLSNKAIAKAFVVLVILIILVGTHINTYSGWEWRYSKDRLEVINIASDLNEKRQITWDYMRNHQNTLQTNSKHMPLYVIIGDSYSKDTLNAIIQNTNHINLKRLSIDIKCQPIIPGDYSQISSNSSIVETKCNEERKTVFENPILQKAEIIILAASWKELGVTQAGATLKYLHERYSSEVVVFGPRIKFYHVPTLVIRHGSLDNIDEYVNKFQNRESTNKLTSKLREAVRANHGIFVDTYAVFCDSAQCPIVTDTKELVYYDKGHWTLEGAKLFGSKLKKANLSVVNKLFSE